MSSGQQTDDIGIEPNSGFVQTKNLLYQDKAVETAISVAAAWVDRTRIIGPPRKT